MSARSARPEAQARRVASRRALDKIPKPALVQPAVLVGLPEFEVVELDSGCGERVAHGEHALVGLLCVVRVAADDDHGHDLERL